MADAMKAAQMFYINCSYTNKEEIDRVAEIKVSDKSDMLYRDQGWMVHITRFAIDSQLSLHYIDKNPDAYWIKFMHEDPTNHLQRIMTSEYRVTEDVNTAAVLLQNINEVIPVVPQALGAAPMPVAKLYMTPDGRFRLETQPTGPGDVSSLGVEPSPAMAKVLGWDEAKLFLDYPPSNTTNTRNVIRWYETVFNGLRSKHYHELSANMWDETHIQMCETLMWNISWAHSTNVGITHGSQEPYAVGTDDTLVADPARGWGPGGQVAGAYPATDRWLGPRGRQVDIIAYYQMNPALRHNGGHGRIQYLANRDNMDTAGRMHLIRPRDHMGTNEPPQGTNLQSRMVVNSDLACGSFSEMRVIAVAPGHRKIRVCRRPGPDVGGNNDGWGRFARLGDSVFIGYHRPGQAVGDRNENVLHEFKIVGIEEVGDATTWGPVNNVANHGAYEGRQQDLTLDNPVPQSEVTRIVAHMAAVAAGTHIYPVATFYGERVDIGTRRAPGDPMVEVNVVNTAVQQAVTTDWQILFGDEGHTHQVGDAVVSPIQVTEGEVGTVVATDLATGLVTIRWATYQPGNGDRLTHYHATAAFKAVWREDCLNMRASVALGNCEVGQIEARRNNSAHQNLYLNAFVNGDETLRKLIDRPSAAQFNTRQLLHSDFFPHQLKVSRIHTHQGYRWKNIDPLVTLADAWSILPYGCPEDGLYFPSSQFTLLLQDTGGVPNWDHFYEWLNLAFANGTLVIDGAGDIVFMPTNLAADDIDRGFAPGARPFAVIQGLIPAAESTDGKNRLLCAWSRPQTGMFTHAHYFGGQKLNGIYFNLDTTYSAMWTEILLKQNTTASVVTALAEPEHQYVKLQLNTFDAIESQLAGQIDLGFQWRSIDIVSSDLLHEPERNQDANSQLPILSSYTLPAYFNPSCNAQGAISGFGSTPFGTIQFSEGGQRRYHSLVKVPGGLRNFSVQAQLTPKDPTNPVKRVMLPNAGSFNCQILFVKRE